MNRTFQRLPGRARKSKRATASGSPSHAATTPAPSGQLFGTLPAGARAALVLTVLVLLWAAANWMVQVWRKPTEMFFPVGQAS